MKLVVLAVALASSAAIAQDATPAGKPAKEKKICRREVETGSIMPKSICHSKAEWAQIDGENAAATSRLSDERQRTNTGFGATGRITG